MIVKRIELIRGGQAPKFKLAALLPARVQLIKPAALHCNGIKIIHYKFNLLLKP